MKKEKINPVTAPAETEASNQRKGGKALNAVINVILVIAIILAAICTYVSFVSSSGNGVPSLFGVEIFSVQTDSMYPTLKSGDLIVCRAMQDSSTLRPGDIITYWTIINGERALNTHRIYQVYDGGGYLIFETKGDNNNLVDSLTVHESEVVGVYSGRVSGLGKVLDFLQTPTGFLIVVVIPVALFFLYQLVQFFKVLFEYQSVKNRLKFEEEQAARLAAIDRAEAEVKAAKQTPEQPQAPPAEEQPIDREAFKAELREQMKAEMMAEMLAELKRQNAAAAEKAAKEEKTEEPAPAEESEETEEPETAEEPEAAEDSETTEEPETIEEPVATEEPEATEESEATEEPEATEEAEKTAEE